MTRGSEPAHRLLGMTDDEYGSVVSILDREPRPAELAMYSVMWSEHCSYKSSRMHLSRFPTEAPWVVVGPGENAGVVDVGDGWLAALRIESHNHPSFVEPYQGAATGVGGIIRDVFTMGARPVALWDQIRFGPLDDPKNRYLFTGVVSGIGGYGNAVGVPTVGGEIEFDPSYSENPLVNVMCLGLMPRERLVLGTAGSPGTVAVLLGRATGRDGIGGASVLASSSFDSEEADKRPSVQVGDPFEEKKLIEACLELYRMGLVEGVQDLGAAGLACATSEPAARAGVGMELDLDAVHTRESDMTAPELLMSESQERMMAYVDPARVGDVLDVARRWEIDAVAVGEVRSGDALVVRHEGEIVAEVPAGSLSEQGPMYDRPARFPDWLGRLWQEEPLLPEAEPRDLLISLLSDPGVGSASWVYEQYDHMLFLNTLIGPGSDGTLLRLEGTDRALAVSTDGNGRLCLLDPRRGAARVVYEAALNVAVCGARPLALVDNLNFGNPEDPEVMWQFKEAIEGISEACEALGIPVVGGNVSFYNETDGRSINPTPVVGLLGVAHPVPDPLPGLSRGEAGMELWELGPAPSGNLAGSALMRSLGRAPSGRPSPPDGERASRSVESAVALSHTAPVLHDISDGGLAVAVAEICISSGVGAVLEETRPAALFSEDPHRFLAAIPPGSTEELEGAGRRVGTLGGGSIDLGGSSVGLEEAACAYRSALADAVSGA